MHTITIAKLKAKLSELNEEKAGVFDVVFNANYTNGYHEEDGKFVEGVLADDCTFQTAVARCFIDEITSDDIKALEVAIAHFEKEQLINRAMSLI